MTIQFEKPLEPQKIWDNLQQRIIDQKFNYALWKKVEIILTKFEGQKITKRILTALEKELTDYTISYSAEYSMYKISIWGNGIAYDQRKTYYIGSDMNDTNILSMVHVRGSNQSWEFEKSRAEKLESMDKSALFMNVDKWNNGLSALQQVNKWAEQYEINYMSYGFDINNR